jgi:hypothetical protein
MRSPQLVRRIVADDPQLAAWDARRRRGMALTIAIRRELPRQLATRVRVVDAQNATLEIVADSGAVAAAVRQRLPAVHAQLVRDGVEFTGIRVRVQVRADVELTPKSVSNPMHKSSADALSRLASSLEPGPLKASLDRLLRRAR